MKSRWIVRGALMVAMLAAALLASACAPVSPVETPDAVEADTPAPADNAAPTPSDTPADEGAAAETPAVETPAETPAAEAAEEGSVNSTFDGALDVTVGAARDLAARLGVPLEQVNLVSEELVEWPDGSLGCPQPGMMYTQVMTDGIRIVMEVGGAQYNYHGGGTRAPFLCENPA